MPLLENKMSLAFAVLVGVLIGGGSVGGIALRNKNRMPVAVPEVKEEAQADAVRSLTEVDLLKGPCSVEYIEKNDEVLCLAMQCRMHVLAGDATAAASCAPLNSLIISGIVSDDCMKFWTEGAGADQNSQYHQCKITYGESK